MTDRQDLRAAEEFSEWIPFASFYMGQTKWDQFRTAWLKENAEKQRTLRPWHFASDVLAVSLRLASSYILVAAFFFAAVGFAAVTTYVPAVGNGAQNTSSEYEASAASLIDARAVSRKVEFESSLDKASGTYPAGLLFGLWLMMGLGMGIRAVVQPGWARKYFEWPSVSSRREWMEGFSNEYWISAAGLTAVGHEAPAKRGMLPM